jgi:hypothetical protein
MVALQWTNAECGLGFCGTGRRLSHGSVVVTTPDDDGRVIHAIRYDGTLEHVLEGL